MAPQTQTIDESTVEAARRYYDEHAQLAKDPRTPEIELEAKKATADLLAELALKQGQLPPPEGDRYPLPPPPSDEASVK